MDTGRVVSVSLTYDDIMQAMRVDVRQISDINQNRTE